MFALEIEFHDGISAPETILVRRTHAIVGSSDLAHVVIEGAASSPCELRLIRGIGREFKCQPVRRFGQESVPPPFLEGTYAGEAEIKLGDVTARITALDSDLGLYGDESPDQAAIRVLKGALTRPSPAFPAVAVLGATPMVLSFHADQPLVLGRSRKCALRLDGSSVAAEHVRVGMDNGQCWVEDLGSETGITVDGARVKGKRFLSSGQEVQIGDEFTFMPVSAAADLSSLNGVVGEAKVATAPVSNYPCIFSTSDQVQPSRFILAAKGLVRVGRDPANDIWISPSHISRKHLEFQWDSPDKVYVSDFSSNGSYLWGERLPRGVAVPLSEGLSVIDLCSGVVLAVCRSAEDEKQFLSNAGSTEKPGAAKRRRQNSSVSVLDDVLDEQREVFRVASSRHNSTGSHDRDEISTDEPDHLATFFGDLGSTNKGRSSTKKHDVFFGTEDVEDDEPMPSRGSRENGPRDNSALHSLIGSSGGGNDLGRPAESSRADYDFLQTGSQRNASTGSGATPSGRSQGFAKEGFAAFSQGASASVTGGSFGDAVAGDNSGALYRELESADFVPGDEAEPAIERPYTETGSFDAFSDQPFSSSGMASGGGLSSAGLSSTGGAGAGGQSMLRGREAAFGQASDFGSGPSIGRSSGGGFDAGFGGTRTETPRTQSQQGLIIDDEYYDEEEEEGGGSGFLRLLLILIIVIFLMVLVVLTVGLLAGDYMTQLFG